VGKSESPSTDKVAMTVRTSRQRRQHLRELVAAEGLRRGDPSYSQQRFCTEALAHWESHVLARLGMTPEEFSRRFLEAMGAGDA